LSERIEESQRVAFLKRRGLPQLAAEDRLPEVEGEPFPFLILAPQIEKSQRHWDRATENGTLSKLIAEVVAERGVDPKHCYVTGVSMGATAAWQLTAREPKRFAALFPVPGSIPDEAVRDDTPPSWVFAGEADQYYSFDDIKEQVNRLRACGREVKLTHERGVCHDPAFWERSYVRADLYEWLRGKAA
jgi:predicted peptidase